MRSFKNFYFIIKKLNYQKTFYFFFLICFLSALLEVISIGSILPLLSFVTGENFLKSYPKIYDILNKFFSIKFFSIEASKTTTTYQ